MKPLNDKQKKYLWIIAGVLVFIHFLPSFINAFREGQGATAKPSAARFAPAQPPPPTPAPEDSAITKYGGVWENATVLPDGNRCSVRVEVRLSDELPKKLKGYSIVHCVPMQVMTLGNISRGQASELVRDYAAPATAVMTGTSQPRGLSFAIDPAASPSSNGCAITGFNFTDFGQGQVMAQWQEGSCPAGNMLLKKARG